MLTVIYVFKTGFASQARYVQVTVRFKRGMFAGDAALRRSKL